MFSVDISLLWKGGLIYHSFIYHQYNREVSAQEAPGAFPGGAAVNKAPPMQETWETWF